MKHHSSSCHFDHIVARYYPFVYKFATRLISNPISALSLTRRVFQDNRTRLSHIYGVREIKAALLTSLCMESIQSPRVLDGAHHRA